MGKQKASPLTWISAIVWGTGSVLNKQIVKGILFFLSEVLIVRYIINVGIENLKLLITLGEREQTKVWNEAKCVYEYIDGDRSLVILLYGIITLAVIVLGVTLAVKSAKACYSAEVLKANGKKVPGFVDEIKDLFDNNLHKTLLTLPLAGVLIFTILPLLFMMCMAFTDYSIIDNKLVLFDWVGLKNFKALGDLGNTIGGTFWSVLGWTLCWAVLATFSNYFLGMGLAILINWKEVIAPKFWRFCFVLTVAVPHFVSLLVIRQMLQPEGAINILLRNIGLIDPTASLPFFTDVT